ncbi:sugar ABC transporter permease [Paenibacillus alginolyticus]|uniref:Sugar ABC transporter permease n=1 Tax=Paenibacillus alginolyticus TaxID=59839 RepID=A0ABT4GH99_9BACL|nr:sugar ABC transporter permease [Paenibacillus alginolyticus]MCY9663529.1 sugar ABC transporter permease [Paenibacillus alginolyticus]MCY9695433.1 sugar ABC transporter permease [Paenibacillus alginolyticus]MEC0146302.1 sugar ABC transporter permease [Paenibacillus alginolyticus]
MRKRNSLFNSYVFIFPSLFLTLALGIYPLVWAFRYMFYDYQGYGQEKFIGIDNFTRLLRDTEFWHSVYNTLIYASGKLIIVLPLSLILAVILNRGMKGKVLLRAVYFMPTIISTSVMAIVFFTIFNSYNGLLNQFLLKYGVISKSIDWLGPDYAMLTVIIMAVWGAIGNYMLLFIAGLQGIPDDLYESASIDGANVVQKFWYITIPMLGPVLQMIVMLAIINSLKGYESIMVMTEGGPFGKTDVMYLYVFKLFFPVSAVSPTVQEVGYGSAAGFVTALIVGLVTVVYFFLSKRLNQD